MENLLSQRPGFSSQHFRHDDILVTEHDGNVIKTPENTLTLVIRSDAAFATRSLLHALEEARDEVAIPFKNQKRCASAFKEILRRHYKTWGHEIIAASVKSLDYGGRYGLLNAEHQRAHVHFHTANSLAGAMMKEACDFIDKRYPPDKPVLFVSIDDMIHENVFRQYASRGTFQEIGFSRIFSFACEERGFVGRPGKDSIEAQLDHARDTARKLQGASPQKVPIILLEDNVRRAKSINWVIDRMQGHGVFQHAEMAGVATCFSVATKEELSNIRFNGKPLPVIIGIDYRDSIVDVITPRDHLFDGFVVEHHGKLGRLPSFMMNQSAAAKYFRINPDHANIFMQNVIDANLGFCEDVKKATGVSPTLQAFVSGPMIADVMGISPETPMEDVLKHRSKNAGLHLTS
jgi:hypothetical protein